MNWFQRTPLIALVLLVAWPGISYSFNKVEISKLEYQALPPMCANAGHLLLQPGIERRSPPLPEGQGQLIWDVGGWHYCNGLVKLRRAELAPRTIETMAIVKDAIRDMDYSLSRINPKEPWAAEMLVAMARAWRILEKPDEAKKFLDIARKNHPSYPQTYLAMATLHFDKAEYTEAVSILKEGVAATEIPSAELEYFLGLAHFKDGNIEAARQQERRARSMGYPLTGLARKLTLHDKSPARDGANP